MQEGSNEEEKTVSVINFCTCYALHFTFLNYLITGKFIPCARVTILINNSINEIDTCLLSMLREFATFLFT
jgi:hypothetical protein